MRTLATGEDFNAFINDQQAVLLAVFTWSKRAQKSLRVFEEWEREWLALHPASRLGFYRLDHDRNPSAGGLYFGDVRGDKGMEGGYGAVAWLRRGVRVGLVRNAAQAGKDTLTRLTGEYFGPIAALNPKERR